MSRAARTSVLVLLAVLLAFPALATPSPGPRKEKGKHHALLIGSVFTAEGLSLPGVQVTVKRKGDRKPKWKAVSDRRGEFAVRLPPGRATYEVTTHSKNRENETKTIEVYNRERVDVFFRLPLKTENGREK